MFPDALIRIGIRREIEMELAKIAKLNAEQRAAKTLKFVEDLKTMPIAIETKKANDQHYEVPDEFYTTVLGPRLKYSSGLWLKENTTFEESEIAMLDLYCERAGLFDGMNLIDLGCGWGSVTLYMAEKYPNSKVTSISNSNSQREYIMDTAKERGLNNVQVFTGDISKFDLPQEFYGEVQLDEHF